VIVTYDTEFLDDGKTIELISIGMVAEDGRELYGINADADWSRIQANPWLVENVLSHLPVRLPKEGDQRKLLWFDDDHADRERVLPKRVLAQLVEWFLGDTLEPDLWAYYSATDHVVGYQLFGSMIEASRDHGWPMRTSCLRQEEESIRRRIRRNRQGSVPEGMTLDGLVSKIFQANYGDRPRQDPVAAHHALHDARHDMALARWLKLTS
jgi:hypothetical protein